VSTQDGTVTFETLHNVQLQASRNEMEFYSWGDPRCCLPKGATRAFLRGSAVHLDLHSGDVLLFEEVLGPESGLAVQADLAHRHAVRLHDEPKEVKKCWRSAGTAKTRYLSRCACGNSMTTLVASNTSAWRAATWCLLTTA
jgi:hypothetical protein